jgi:DNA-binding LytR/AlgR family response regulator
MLKNITCIIVDDDELDRIATVAQVMKFSNISIIGVFADALKALEEIHLHQPDIIFLDIDMPNLNGLELRRRLHEIPACVFITSYPDYALDAFEVEALDFIVKPIRTERFAQTISRIENYLTLRSKAHVIEHEQGNDSVFFKNGHDHFKLNVSEIIYLEALKDYTLILTEHNKHCVLSSIGNLLKQPSFNNFIRIHRSYAVQKKHIQKISSNDLIVHNIKLPIGRSFKNTLEQLL